MREPSAEGFLEKVVHDDEEFVVALPGNIDFPNSQDFVNDSLL